MKDLKMTNILAGQLWHTVYDIDGKPVDPEHVVAVYPEHGLTAMHETKNIFLAIQEMNNQAYRSINMDKTAVLIKASQELAENTSALVAMAGVEMMFNKDEIDEDEEDLYKFSGTSLTNLLITTSVTMLVDIIDFKEDENLFLLTLETSKGPVLMSASLTNEAMKEDLIKEALEFSKKLNALFSGELSE